MDNLFTQKIINANEIFSDSFIDAKKLYLFCFNTLPSLNYIGYIDGEKCFAALCEKYKDSIDNIHTSRWFKQKHKKFQFDKTVIILKQQVVIELDDDYCEILHDGKNPEWVEEMAALVFQFKEKQRKQPLEINLIVQSRNRLDLKAMEIKRTKLDLDLFYEDDFKAVDQVIQQRLKKNNDKGIVLLHGLPGTGKTTYLRYLVGRLKKRVLFLSPSVAGNLMNPDFIELLMDNPNTVLVIEDAENIIMDRRHNNSSSVSNLLNISDGLLADFLNVQLICTFNSELTLVDNALLRKGRLIARYEFGKLSVVKAQALSKHLGFNATITAPMTIAELANPAHTTATVKSKEVIGFRVMEQMNN